MTNPYGKGTTLDAKIVRSEVVSASEFIAMIQQSPSEIKSSRPVGPQLGRPGFGGIEVVYANPKYRVA